MENETIKFIDEAINLLEEAKARLIPVDEELPAETEPTEPTETEPTETEPTEAEPTETAKSDVEKRLEEALKILKEKGVI